MKIGLSFSRCVRDIVEGHVEFNDVLVIISRTDFDPHDDTQWHDIWEGYALGSSPFSNPEWYDHKDKEGQFRTVAKGLYDSGKLHQPRKFGANPRRRPEIWLETILPSEELDKNPTVKAAWQRFQTLASLSSVELNDSYQ
jgi:hypothetical protein